MKHLLLPLLLVPFVVSAVPVKKPKKNKQRPPAEEPAVPADRPAAPAVSRTAFHQWTAAGGKTLEARFKALENGILTVETKDRRTVRFPLARLSAEDQKLAQALKAQQPRPPMEHGIIVKAAARLDESINEALKKAGTPVNPPVSDAVFVRRVYLDTIGRIPTADEASSFLSDRSPDKRAALIDRLLDSPGYAMHMFNWLADMLRVKDDYGRGARAFLYEDWLKDQIAMNRPWDAMVRDMLTADGKLNENGAAGFLLRDAQMPLDGVSNMLTTFLGADVSCAQCHDHPFAEWTQKDFYGMAAFFGASDGYHENTFRRIRQIAKSLDGKAKQGAVNQLLTSNAFDMVDLPKNRLKFPGDYKYDNAKPGGEVAPSLIRWEDTAKSNPAYQLDDVKPSQLRNEFAEWMTHPENPRFATAIANRVWKKVFGLAVQEPVADLDNPAGASNPDLLKQITTYMVQAKFDLREFQRILFNTAAYQRQAAPAPEDPKKYLFPGPLLRRLSAEQAWDSIVTLASGDDADHILLRRGDDLRETVLPFDSLTKEKVEEVLSKAQARTRMVGAAGGGNPKKGGQFNPRALAFFYEGGKPQQRAGLVLARASELPQPAPENHFLRLFGQSDRLVADTCTTDGSVPQMLQLMNGPVQEVVTAGSRALTAAAKTSELRDKVTSLYHSFLSRPPTAAEADNAVAVLQDGLTPADLAWVLLNSREFLFVQ